MNINNKLMFVLCQECEQYMNRYECTHNDENRALSGTWVNDEVVKAIEKGYTILDIYEIWQYKTERFNKQLEEGLFAAMVNNLLK